MEAAGYRETMQARFATWRAVTGLAAELCPHVLQTRLRSSGADPAEVPNSR